MPKSKYSNASLKSINKHKMTIEYLEKARLLNDEIKKCRFIMENINYSLMNNIENRTSNWSFIGISRDIPIPKELFKIIGQLIMDEYKIKLINLQKQFDDL
jgi:hypothetical protein